ncbi:MAG: helix-turn-helix domain-containing protein [Actinobacteria bacterium]|nr:helix-turn-helix domain-containing protein [Actinomycetota bacterium]
MFSEELSEKARLRLKWITHFKQKGNVDLTCRHFDISRSKFYYWIDTFCAYGLRGLEDRSRAPKNKRRSNVPWQVVDLVVRTRREHPCSVVRSAIRARFALFSVGRGGRSLEKGNGVATPLPPDSFVQIQSHFVDEFHFLFFLYRAIFKQNEFHIHIHLAGLFLDQQRPVTRRHVIERHGPYRAYRHIDKLAEHLFPGVASGDRKSGGRFGNSTLYNSTLRHVQPQV